MLRLRYATIVGLCLAISPLRPALAAEPPVIKQIDSICDGYSKAKDAKPYYLTRYSTRMMKMTSGWMSSDPTHDEKIRNSSNYVQGEFVSIIARSNHILYVVDSSSDASGDGGIVRYYCYVNDSLAGASVEVADVPDEMSWTRVAYFKDGKPIADRLVPRDLAKKRTKSPPPAPRDALAIAAYTVPQRLPYYAAFKSAVAGTLPKVK